ncbi:hypothetical protein EVAR_80584_1 [Eumeta japonica]|uniref:Tc1-like transposase DDE domain-containing protein n=1 Tax=Eumeta variegata TaxID=151549 RepID=A0A4C1TLM6_EUMVA|nr:hypothetical protein EVAR_80584_1 [Eumeta japonica]
MIYDVNCYIKKETDEIVPNLKSAKTALATTSTTLQNNLVAAVQMLCDIRGRSRSVSDQTELTEICHKLQQCREASQASQALNTKLQDESYVDSSHSNPKAEMDGSIKGLKQPILKGQHVLIVHAGSETGFVPNALLTFKAGYKTGDYHNMTAKNFEKWLRTQLIPNLPPRSVVVVDNASYHNKQYDPAPTSNSRKAEM